MSWNSLYGREPSVSSNKKWLSLYHLQYSCCLCQDEEMRSQAGSRGRRPPCGTLCTEAQRELLSGSQWQLRRARLRVGPLPGRGVRGVTRPAPPTPGCLPTAAPRTATPTSPCPAPRVGDRPALLRPQHPRQRLQVIFLHPVTRATRLPVAIIKCRTLISKGYGNAADNDKNDWKLSVFVNYS